MSARGAIATLLAPGGLTVDFQPIVKLDGRRRRLLGVEALTRGPRGTNMHSSPVLFDYVRRKREEVAVDRGCVAASLAAAVALPPDTALSINVHAATLSRDPEFLTFLADTAEAHAVALQRITLEISHHAPFWEGESLRSVVDALRPIGVRLALDEVGLGQANYQMILECKPDLFKVDRYFVTGCAADFHRQAILESIQALARRFGARVVAEGVESEADLAALDGLGIELAQGYLFAPPQSAQALVESGLLEQFSTA